MIQVDKKADNLKDGITNMMLGAKDDYIKMSTSNGKKELVGYSKEQVDNWDNKTKVSEGKKYIKIVQDTGVFAFVMKEDSGRFKKGDILKPAGYRVALSGKTHIAPREAFPFEYDSEFKTNNPDLGSFGDMRPICSHIQQQRCCIGTKLRLSKFACCFSRANLARCSQQLFMPIFWRWHEEPQHWLSHPFGNPQRDHKVRERQKGA